MTTLPFFYGRNVTPRTIQEFYKNFDLHCQMKHINNEDRVDIFDNCIHGPAESPYRHALDNGDIVEPVAPAVDADDAAVLAWHTETMTNR